MAQVPQCFTDLLAAWNERDANRRNALIAAAVTEDIAFTDPQYAITGRTAFIKMVDDFHARVGEVELLRTSGIDMHHDRARYSWEIHSPDGSKFLGFDAVALNMAEQKICRIDGFFGPLPRRD